MVEEIPGGVPLDLVEKAHGVRHPVRDVTSDEADDEEI